MACGRRSVLEEGSGRDLDADGDSRLIEFASDGATTFNY
jgi:hypothetical protein